LRVPAVLITLRALSTYQRPFMRADIHPGYKEIEVVCSCGNKFKTRSTLAKDALHIEVCAMCHPFYTGKQKLVDTAGRVDKFKKRYARTGKAAQARA
jgi:large subunit ribosomal protein L31